MMGYSSKLKEQKPCSLPWTSPKNVPSSWSTHLHILSEILLIQLHLSRSGQRDSAKHRPESHLLQRGNLRSSRQTSLCFRHTDNPLEHHFDVPGAEWKETLSEEGQRTPPVICKMRDLATLSFPFKCYNFMKLKHEIHQRKTQVLSRVWLNDMKSL